ncbi:MAG: hypothetical protein J3K34DRAFT_522447 [Monoraphidium minutum]|nr:MAG: hypothetical protein J3K34DRAFT_522447 [Monoraphidium minutum]
MARRATAVAALTLAAFLACAALATAQVAPKPAAKPAATSAAAAAGKPLRQLFLWSLKGGVPVGKAAKATRTALYDAWNKANPKQAVTSYWLGAQDDDLLFSPTKDATWADVGGYTDFASADLYNAFKNWEKAQPSYAAIPVTTRTRLVSYA